MSCEWPKTLPPVARHSRYWKTFIRTQLAAAGVELHVGERVQYVISSAGDKVKDWRVTPLALIRDHFEFDQSKYLELPRRAYQTIIEGLC